jgi:RecA/RadA recombinase
MAVSMSFLADFEKEVSKIEGVTGQSIPPRNWFSFGNYVLNRVMSGSFRRGTPQGRITCVAGPSGSGKSFVVGNLVKNAQMAGAYILVIDSENALDNDYMEGIGVDTNDGYNYKDVSTINQVVNVVSKFIKGYHKAYGTIIENPDQPPVLIAIDSLDMLSTDTEQDHFAKGDAKGDQGQRSKQLKAMLRNFVTAIKHLNIQMVVTHQVYRASQEQILAGEGVWKVGDAIRYACSQILLVTKLKLKAETGGAITGIRMKCEGFKTRFALPFQTVTIEVPYTTGMDPNSGIIEAFEAAGILKRGGSWYSVPDTEIKFQSKDLDTYVDRLLKIADDREGLSLIASEEDDEEQGKETSKDLKLKRKNVAAGTEE